MKGATGFRKENFQTFGGFWGDITHTLKQDFFNTPRVCLHSPTWLRKRLHYLRAHLVPTHKWALNPGMDSLHEFGNRGQRGLPTGEQKAVLRRTFWRCWDLGCIPGFFSEGSSCWVPVFSSQHGATMWQQPCKPVEICWFHPTFNFEELKINSFIFFHSYHTN